MVDRTAASDVTCRLYDSSDASMWDAFIENSVNGTLMHTRRLLSYHPENRFLDHSLIFSDEKNNVVAVFPAATKSSDEQRVLRSHPGATYGGLVVDAQLSSTLARGLVASLIEHAIEQRFDAIWMRLPERVFHRRGCEELDAALFCGGFQLVGRELSCAVRTSTACVRQAPTSFSQSSARSIRKALSNGVVARQSNDFRTYWRILENNLKNSHGVEPTHSLAEAESLVAKFPDQIWLMGAFLEDKMIAGTWVLEMNKAAAHTMYIAQDCEYQSVRPLNLVLASALQQCAARGIPWLNYGISSIPGSAGRLMNDGLYQFKRSCGGEGFVRDIWQLDLKSNRHDAKF